MPALKAHIEKTYALEHAPEAVEARLEDGRLEVEVKYCPGVRHLRQTGREVSKWYVNSTTAVMQTVADSCGLAFEMGEYDPQTGRARYAFAAA